jgi:hypothetical protein
MSCEAVYTTVGCNHHFQPLAYETDLSQETAARLKGQRLIHSENRDDVDLLATELVFRELSFGLRPDL